MGFLAYEGKTVQDSIDPDVMLAICLMKTYLGQGCVPDEVWELNE